MDMLTLTEQVRKYLYFICNGNMLFLWRLQVSNWGLHEVHFTFALGPKEAFLILESLS